MNEQIVLNECIQYMKVFKVAKKRQSQITSNFVIYWKNKWEFKIQK